MQNALTHCVIPHGADFFKHVVEAVDLLDGLQGLGVEGNQYELSDYCGIKKHGRLEQRTATNCEDGLCPLTGFAALKLHNKWRSDKRAILSVLVFIGEVCCVVPVTEER